MAQHKYNFEVTKNRIQAEPSSPRVGDRLRRRPGSGVIRSRALRFWSVCGAPLGLVHTIRGAVGLDGCVSSCALLGPENDAQECNDGHYDDADNHDVALLLLLMRAEDLAVAFWDGEILAVLELLANFLLLGAGVAIDTP